MARDVKATPAMTSLHRHATLGSASTRKESPCRPEWLSSPAAWHAVMDTNLKATFQCAQRFARIRRATGGARAIVNLASTAAF